MKTVNRLKRLRELMASEDLDAVVIRSVTDLMWITGFERVFDSEEAHVAVITEQGCFLHSDSRYSSALRSAAAQEGIWQIDDRLLPIAGFVAFALKKAGIEQGKVAIDALTPLALYRRMVAELPGFTLVERSDDVLNLRSIKEPDELQRLQAAQAIADRAFLEFLADVRPGQTEREASLALEFALRRNGADELAFPNIVASGPNSANPHAIAGERRLAVGDFVVIDFGARLDGYRSDTTRTIMIGKPSAKQQRIYDTVRLANEEVAKALAVGVTGSQMQAIAEGVLSDAGFAGAMGHSLGHGVGLDIHELPNLSSRNDVPLVSGNVVTVEPGIYLEGADGVRIEDFGVVTEDGFVNFCGLSHGLQVVE